MGREQIKVNIQRTKIQREREREKRSVTFNLIIKLNIYVRISWVSLKSKRIILDSRLHVHVICVRYGLWNGNQILERVISDIHWINKRFTRVLIIWINLQQFHGVQEWWRRSRLLVCPSWYANWPRPSIRIS